ncbi:MAG: type II secretion system GspH family protein [Planctomycetales bacterium]|nr:type II secretion system GspH family protein [Planctomycetales bacterium]
MRIRSRPRTGFTLIEALVAIGIMALAGSVLLLASQTSLDATDEAAKQAIAQGICEQVLDEIMSKRYMEAGSTYDQNTLSHDSGESARLSYDDSDDFNGYSAQPIRGTDGTTLGNGNDAGGQRLVNFRIASGFFNKWRLRVDVYYVSSIDLSVRLDNPAVAAGGTLSSTSGYRAAEVTVEYQDTDGTYKTLAQGRRVYAYVPPPT